MELISEDELRTSAESEIQKLTDKKYSRNGLQRQTNKEQEVMSV